MCLEEMLQTEIERGYLFYGETKRRKEVDFTVELRKKVRRSFEEMHNYYEKRYTPRAKSGTFCKQCSLQNICMPELGETLTVANYLEKALREDMK